MSESTTTTLLHTPFYPRLRDFKAKWVNFAGWEMPVEFSGILAEHRAVRQNAGLFDLSHMGELEVRAANVDDAVAHVQRLVTNDVSKLAPGAALYSAVCNDGGTILDDVLVYRFADHVMLVVNASNKDKMLAWFTQHAPAGVTIVDKTNDTALLAIQGPAAESMLGPLSSVPLGDIRYYHFSTGSIGDVPCVISRTGYTGEDGFELYVDAARALEVFDAVWKAGEPKGLIMIGLGARDTLRLEARYALYGNDIDETTNPYEAGLGWVVKLQKGDFIGREALTRIKAEGPRRTLVGFGMEDRGVPRHGFEVHAGNHRVGEVTSGTFSPTLEQAIGLAYVARDDHRHYELGAALDIMIRNNRSRARVVKTPFYRGSVRS